MANFIGVLLRRRETATVDLESARAELRDVQAERDTFTATVQYLTAELATARDKNDRLGAENMLHNRAFLVSRQTVQNFQTDVCQVNSMVTRLRQATTGSEN